MNLPLEAETALLLGYHGPPVAVLQGFEQQLVLLLQNYGVGAELCQNLFLDGHIPLL